jgi:hypothetical protein
MTVHQVCVLVLCDILVYIISVLTEANDMTIGEHP